MIIGPLFLAGPIWGGVCIYSLKVIRGEHVEFGDLFSGFSNFGGYLAAFFLILIMVAIVLFIIMATLMPLMSVTQSLG